VFLVLMLIYIMFTSLVCWRLEAYWINTLWTMISLKLVCSSLVMHLLLPMLMSRHFFCQHITGIKCFLPLCVAVFCYGLFIFCYSNILRSSVEDLQMHFPCFMFYLHSENYRLICFWKFMAIFWYPDSWNLFILLNLA
jgi:hypothetical protein